MCAFAGDTRRGIKARTGFPGPGPGLVGEGARVSPETHLREVYVRKRYTGTVSIAIQFC